VIVLSVVFGYMQAQSTQRQESAPATGSAPSQRAFLDQYCISCHNQRSKTAGLALDTVDPANVGAHAEIWEKVTRKLQSGLMPPSGARRPDPATNKAFNLWLETELDRAAGIQPNAGRTPLHRLNRNEYVNAVRDLLAVEVEAASLLPPDDSSYGFDNMAGALGFSPVLLERYVAAAAKISRLAIGDPTTAPAQQTYAVRADLTQDRHIEGLPLGTRGGLLVRHSFPVDGEYLIKVRLLHAPAGGLFGINTKGEQLEINVDGERVGLFKVDTEKDRMEVRMPVRAGWHSVGAAFLERNFVSEDAIALQRTTIEPTMCAQPGWTCLPHAGSVTITGPFNATGRGDTASRQRIFVCRPAGIADETPCATEIISTLARRAFRKPINSEHLEVLMSFYKAGREEGDFDQGIEMALRRILASPEFMFRFEPDPAGVAPGNLYRIGDLELASRLSFFLWSSIPDDELLQIAGEGKLQDPAALEQQVRRMLRDSRSQALVRNFAGQWLYLRNLDGMTPGVREFPEFDDNLRRSFRRETELLFENIVRDDRPVLELLTADYTFVNERVARHYGIPNVYGDHFRRVTLGESFDERRGLLGHGSILTVTSYPTRTSPVLRGKWVLENLLGTPPPEPPPNVPDLKENTKENIVQGQAPSVRERLEEHRSNPACASCHNVMDPIGFSLENFDAVGKWRTVDGTTPIDASGQLIDGTPVNSPSSLRRALLAHSEQFVRTMTERLLTYAAGRGIEYYDMPVVRSIARDASGNDYRFSSLIMGIVKSTPFQMKMKAREGQPAAAVIPAR
jgi:hypothetical protein